MWMRLREWMAYKRGAAKAHRDYRKTRDAFQKERKGKPPTDRQLDTERFELSLIEDELQHLNTRRLIQQAHYYGIPLPAYPDENAWDVTSSTGLNVLTVRAMNDLRALVRKEQNERWQFWELRVKIISLLLTGITGAAGALIGLVAILYK